MSLTHVFSRGQRGVTLVELMIAMVLGLLVAGGIVSVFLSTSSSNRVQTQMARLQEEGRFAVDRISGDLKMAGSQYCSSTGGIANTMGAGVALDALRTPKILSSTITFPQNTTAWGTPYPVKPTVAYPMPSFLFMRGYDCTKTKCGPADPSAPTDGVPKMGTALDQRVVGASVLTLRYVDSSRGWAIGGSSVVVAKNNGDLDHVTIVPKTGEPSLAGFADGEQAMLADCSTAQIFSVNGSPDFKPDTTNFSQPRALQPQSAPRFFRLKTDLRTVTYYLQVKTDDGTATGNKTGALMRCDSGTTGPCAELVRGVERLDFRYGVEDSDGLTHFLSAAEVDSNNTGKIACPPNAPDALTPDTGCLWRAVKSIEMHLLMDGQVPLFSLTAPEIAFTYQPDAITTPAAPNARGTNGIAPSDQGFDDHMIRREFSTLVMMRNYNP
ncbi:type IV pilus assembly protein PilW [Luteibacter rhizovicinus]|uniref:Type IV pilus assembly protein PilW n=1 Tax=Luteibacter rhizovicinus TaxID=242606 RepID=A0A4V2W4V6_9GAMM|nr:PilW family protein [Luteibacter rhizovicinus]TCV97029.1 type IV pilus assembly protein PilW [Luteibacter rhizovicinus]